MLVLTAALTLGFGSGSAFAQDSAPVQAANPPPANGAQQPPPQPSDQVMEGIFSGSERGMRALRAWLGIDVPLRELKRRVLHLVQSVRARAAEMTPDQVVAALGRIMDLTRASLARGQNAPGGAIPEDVRLAIESELQTAMAALLQDLGTLAQLQDIAPAAGPNTAQQAIPLDLPPPVFENTDQASPS